MKRKYETVGLNYDLIIDKYPDINEYEEIVNAYLEDEFFDELENMLDNEDYELAKDAVKGLYILASDLMLFPLYERLLEVYEDLEYEMYNDVMEHYHELHDMYKKIRGAFNA